MNLHLSRRSMLLAAAGLIAPRIRGASGQTVSGAFSLPIGLPSKVLGDGFFIGHGYACENTWYNPGWLHTAEDYYLIQGNTDGAGVYAVADGEIVFAGSNYPGRVLIVQHNKHLFSMYGHLDFALVRDSGMVQRGDLLGTIFDRTDGRAPSHLHFEIRTFLTTLAVNGNAPRYAVSCGFECPPGPGYWPIDAPEHPSAMGWRNPTHVMANRAFGGRSPDRDEVVVASGTPTSLEFWSAPRHADQAERIGEIALEAGQRFELLAIDSGPEDSLETSAEGYQLWYQIRDPEIGTGWAPGITPSTQEIGSDGRPSALRFNLLTAVMANPG